MSLIDTHAHLYYESMENLLSEVLERASSKGVNKIVCIGTDIDTSLKSVNIAEKYDNVFATVGIHPHDAKDVSSDYIMQLEELSKHDKVVAIGEIGIDNFRNLSPINIQKKVMIEQIELATSQDLPIVFHNRDADDDILDVLNSYKFYKALAHCYSSDLSFAKKLISLDILLSFSGNVTFKNATNIEVVQNISLCDFVLEPDCPFLAPHPFRGTKNEPVQVHTVAEKIAEIRSDSIQNIAEATTRNAQNFFKI